VESIVPLVLAGALSVGFIGLWIKSSYSSLKKGEPENKAKGPRKINTRSFSEGSGNPRFTIHRGNKVMLTSEGKIDLGTENVNIMFAYAEILL
jgi:hypothetical protein